MTQREITSTVTELVADPGKWLHKTGTDTYVPKAPVPTADIDKWEEVDDRPAYTKEEYEAEVARLVRERYTADEEFALQRKAINAAFSPAPATTDSTSLEEYAAYNAYVEQCKSTAKESLSAGRESPAVAGDDTNP